MRVWYIRFEYMQFRNLCFPKPYLYHIPIFISIVSCFYAIGRQSIWLDEALTLDIARNWNSMWNILLFREPYMWLYYIFLFLWTRFGQGEAYVRSLSAIFAVMTIPFIYLLASRIYTRKVGAIAALFISINMFFVQYAQEVRSYSLLLLLVTISSYYYVLTISSSSAKNAKIYTLATIASVYAHHVAIFYILPQILLIPMLRLDKKLRHKMGVLFFFICLGITPLLFFRPTTINISWIQPPSMTTLVNSLILLSGGHWILLSLYGVFIFFGFSSLLTQRSSQDIYQKLRRVYAPTMFILPILAIYMVSIFIQPLFVSRYILPSIIPIVLIGSFGALQLKNIYFRFFSLVLFITISSLSLFAYYNQIQPYALKNFIISPKEDWRGVGRFISLHATDTDHVIFYTYYAEIPFRYYLEINMKNSSPTYTIDSITSKPYTIGGILPEPDLDRIKAITQSNHATWLVLSHHTIHSLQRDRQTNAVKKMIEKNAELINVYDFQGIQIAKYVGKKPND